MKAVKIFGLVVFSIGFFLFNATAFWASYRLTAEVVREKIDHKQKLELFTAHASPVIGQTFTSNHDFVSALDDVFERANKQQLQHYKITDAEIEEIIERSKNKFT